MTQSKKIAKPTQIVEVLQAVNQAAMKEIGNNADFDAIQRLIGNKSKINKAIGAAMRELLGKVENPWADQIAGNQELWAKYGVVVDVNLPLPEFKEGHKLEYVPVSKTETELVQIYSKEFGNLSGNGYSKDPASAIHDQQARPKGDYWFSWNPTIEPDTEHFNKSYNMFKDDGNKYMVPKEGIICALTTRLETGNMLDVNGLTRFHAVDSSGYVLLMRRYVYGYFYIGHVYPDLQYSDHGPRQVNIS